MRIAYHHFAGRSLDRLAALSDGVFAVAMTLLVLDVHVPVVEVVRAQRPLWEGGALEFERALAIALGHLAPSLLTYFMSFLTLGMFWVGQQTQLDHFRQGNRSLTWIHLAFLMAVSLVPFSTALLAAFITHRLALLVYWLNLLLLGAALFASWRYAQWAGLVTEEASAEVRRANERRIVIAQALYALAVLLCVISPYVSIVLIVLLQLNSAIAPRVFPLDRF